MPTESSHLPVTLRAGRIADAGAMAWIEQSSFSDPWPEAAFADLVEAVFARTVVAEGGDGSLAGYCLMLVAADEAEIANIAVAVGCRRHGVGAQLLDRTLAQAVLDGIRSVYLEVRVSNSAARRLYASRGFMAVGRRRDYYQHPTEDALILRCEMGLANSRMQPEQVPIG